MLFWLRPQKSFHAFSNQHTSSINNCLLLFVLVFIVAFSKSCSDAKADDFSGTNLPPKGDNYCPSLSERYAGLANGNDKYWFSSCEEGDAYVPAQVPQNGFSLLVYTSLPAYGQDYSTWIAPIVWDGSPKVWLTVITSIFLLFFSLFPAL